MSQGKFGDFSTALTLWHPEIPTQALRMSSCPESSSSAVMISRSMDLPQKWGRRYAFIGIGILLIWSCWDLKCSKASQHWMFWISSRQRYQNEVSLPGPRCPLHICIDVLRQTQSSHVPSQTPKYHKIPHSKSQWENAGICFLEILVLYLVCICFFWFVWFLVCHNPWELGGSKWWVPKSAAKKTTRPRIGIDDEKRRWKAKA